MVWKEAGSRDWRVRRRWEARVARASRPEAWGEEKNANVSAQGRDVAIDMPACKLDDIYGRR
jgi:hypothetical protein